jgi:hypothetical protein
MILFTSQFRCPQRAIAFWNKILQIFSDFLQDHYKTAKKKNSWQKLTDLQVNDKFVVAQHRWLIYNMKTGKLYWAYLGVYPGVTNILLMLPHSMLANA